MLTAMSLAVENVLRLLLAALLGAMVGFERERNEQPAGLRTNILVSIGACLFTLMSTVGIDRAVGDLDTPIRFDPSRVVSQVVVGIGFLGAGAIIKHGLTVRGLTTAAGLWVVAAIGTAVGLGSYDLALAATGIALVALYALRPARRWVHQLGGGRDEIVVRAGPDAEVTRVLAAARRAARGELQAEVEIDADGSQTVALSAEFGSASSVDALVAELGKVMGVRGVETRA
jgi:putative Mg2+ transporter-C (MgtC) family protein